MVVTKIPINGGWMPDYLPHNMPKGGLSVCRNLLPLDEFYKPHLSLNSYSTDTVSGIPLRGEEFKDNSDNKYTFIGTSTGLYRLNPDKTITNVSKISYTYTAVNSQWDFLQYGQWIIATDYSDVPQVLKNLDSSNFIDLGGSPPKAKYMIFNSGHLIFANLNEGGVISPKKLLWSALEDVETYTPSLTTGADYQDLADADTEITGLASVSNLISIFHKNAISIGWFSGSPYTFNFSVNKIKKIGAIPGTQISIGTAVFFWDEKDIYVFDGNTATAIGLGVRNYILNTLNQGYLHRITKAHDIRNGIIYWAYPDASSTTGESMNILCYNYRTKKFTILDANSTSGVNCIFHTTTGALLMDSIDSLYPSLDLIPYNVDSNFWLANNQSIGAIPKSATQNVMTYSGTATTGELETGEISTGNGDIIRLQRVRPRIQDYSSTTTVKGLARFNENVDTDVQTGDTALSAGYANLRVTGRYVRINLKTDTHSGIPDEIEADLIKTGGR
jgi:hypothetical protein